MGMTCSKEMPGRVKRPTFSFSWRSSSKSGTASLSIRKSNAGVVAGGAAAGPAAAAGSAADKAATVAAVAAKDEEAAKKSVADEKETRRREEGREEEVRKIAAASDGETNKEAAAAVAGSDAAASEEKTWRETAARATVDAAARQEQQQQGEEEGGGKQKEEERKQEEEEEQQQEKEKLSVEGVVDRSVVVVGGKKPEGREAAAEGRLQPPPHFLAMDGVEVSETFTFYVEIFGLKCKNLLLPAFLSTASSPDGLFNSSFLDGGDGPSAAAAGAARAGENTRAAAAASFSLGRREQPAAKIAAAGAGEDEERRRRRKEGEEEGPKQQQQQRSSVTQWLLLPFLAGASKEQQQSLRAAAALQAAAAERHAAGSLDQHSSLLHPYIFCAVDWVDCTLYVETEGVPVTTAPAWPSSKCQFSWRCSLLRQLQQRRVIISVYCCIPQQLQEEASPAVPPPLLPQLGFASSRLSALAQRHLQAAAASAATHSPAAAALGEKQQQQQQESDEESPAAAAEAAGASCPRRQGGGEVLLNDEKAADGAQQQQEGGGGDSGAAAARGDAEVQKKKQQQREEGAANGGGGGAAAAGRKAAGASEKKEKTRKKYGGNRRGGNARQNEEEILMGGGVAEERQREIHQRRGILTLLGRASVDLLTVATGPVHHDLLLRRPKLPSERQQKPRRQQQVKTQQQQQQQGAVSGGGQKKEDEDEEEEEEEGGGGEGEEGREEAAAREEEDLIACGRVVVDIKMAQICRLIINPIEILVRLQQEQHAVAASASSKAGTAGRLAAASLRAAARSSKRAAAAVAARTPQPPQRNFEDETEFFAAAVDVSAAAGEAAGGQAAAAQRSGGIKGGDKEEREGGRAAAAAATKQGVKRNTRAAGVKAKCPEVVPSSGRGAAAAVSSDEVGKERRAAPQQQQHWQRERGEEGYGRRDRWSAAGAAATAAAAAAAAAAVEQQLEATDVGGAAAAAAQAEVVEEKVFMEGEMIDGAQQLLQGNEADAAAAVVEAAAVAAGAAAAGAGGGGASNSPLVPPEEEPAPLLAHWQLSFRVTGVDNAAAFYSTWTEKTDQPYWNTVDHSLLQLTGRSVCLYTASHPPSPSEKKQQQQRNGRESEAAAVQKEELKQTAAAGGAPAGGSLDTHRKGGGHTAATASTSETEGKGESGWRSLLSALGLGSWRTSASDSAAAAMSSSSSSSSSSAETDAAAAASTSSSSNSPATPGTPQMSGSSSFSPKAYMGEKQQEREEVIFDRDSTYKRLGALARRGRLVKDVLYDDFPTLQLVTTVDALRQNYLHISLFSRCFPTDVPVFQGECWLPFMKLYEADVADEVEKHFYESSFCERLWMDGRCVGEIEGILVFQNNPIVRQMHAGVHTERGCMRAVPPIVQLQQQLEHDDVGEADDLVGHAEEEDEEEEQGEEEEGGEEEEEEEEGDEEEEEGEEEEGEEEEEEEGEEEEEEMSEGDGEEPLQMHAEGKKKKEEEEEQQKQQQQDGRGEGEKSGLEGRRKGEMMKKKKKGRKSKGGKEGGGKRKRKRKGSRERGGDGEKRLPGRRSTSIGFSSDHQRARENLLRLLPPPIQKVAALHRVLLELLFSKAQHKPQEILLEHVIQTHAAAASAAAPEAAKGEVMAVTAAAADSGGARRMSGRGGGGEARGGEDPTTLGAATAAAGHALAAAAAKYGTSPLAASCLSPIHGKRLPPATDDGEDHIQKDVAAGVEFQRVCEELLQLLSEGEGEMRRCFLYATEEALLAAQQVLLNLATHILEYVDYVHWQNRIFYSSILHLILRRGELDIGTLLPSRAAVKKHYMRLFLRSMQAVLLLQEEEEAAGSSQTLRGQQHIKEEKEEGEQQRRKKQQQGQQQLQHEVPTEAEKKEKEQEGENKKEEKAGMMLQKEEGDAEETATTDKREEAAKEQEPKADDAVEEEIRQRRQQELQDIERDLSSTSENEDDDEEKSDKEEIKKQRQEQQRLSLNLAKIHLLYCFVKQLSSLSPRSSLRGCPQQQHSDAAATCRAQATAAAAAAAVTACPHPPRPPPDAVAEATEAAEVAAAAAASAGGGAPAGGGASTQQDAGAQVKKQQQQPLKTDVSNTGIHSRRSSGAAATAREVTRAAVTPGAAAAPIPASASTCGAAVADMTAAAAPSPPAAAAGDTKKRLPKKKTLSHLRTLLSRKRTPSGTQSAAGAPSLQQQRAALQQQLQPQVSDRLAEEGVAASPLICTAAMHAAATAAVSGLCVDEQRSMPRERRAHEAAAAAADAGAAPCSAARRADREEASEDEEDEKEGEQEGGKRGRSAAAARAAGRGAAEGRHAAARTFDTMSPRREESCGVLLREGSTFSYTSGKSLISSHPSFVSAAGGPAQAATPAAWSGQTASPLASTAHGAAAAASDKWDGDTSTAAGGSCVYSEVQSDIRLQQPWQGSSSSGIDAVVVAALARMAQDLPEAGRQAITIYHKRMKIARQYYLLLHRMLLHAVEQLKPGAARGVVFEAQRRYVAVFLAIAYFRLPAFKDSLLACVLSKAEREEPMPEWRGTEYSLDSQSLQRMQQWDKHSELRVSLDWTAFHSTLRGYFGSAALRQAVSCMYEECGAFPYPPGPGDHPPVSGDAMTTSADAAAATATASASSMDDAPASDAAGGVSVFPAALSSSWQWHFSPANRGSLFFAFLEQWCRYVFQSVPSLCSIFAPATGAAATNEGGPSLTSFQTQQTAAAPGWSTGRTGGDPGATTTLRRPTGVPLIGAAAVFQKKTAAVFAAALTGTRGKPAGGRPSAAVRAAGSQRASTNAAISPGATDLVPSSRRCSAVEGSGVPAMLLLLPWQEIPGYAVLLKALLLEMKKRPVTTYPDALLNSSGAMLANVKLLSVFSKVLFLKTSVYNSPAVFAALNYLDYWMQVVRMRGQQLPAGFDFNFLRRGLQIVVSSDICVNVAKGIWFIYKNLPVLLLLRQAPHQLGEPVYAGESTGPIPGMSRSAGGRGGSVSAGAMDRNAGANILFLLVHEQFPRLFLSWSWLVRKAYMWFLLYRVCETARRVVTRANPLLAAARAGAQAMAAEAAAGAAAVPSSPIPAIFVAAAASDNNERAATQATADPQSNSAGVARSLAANSGSATAPAAAGSKHATGRTVQQGSNSGTPGEAATLSMSTAETGADAMLRDLLLQLQLTEEEIILFQAYMVLAGFLKRLDAPLVLPYKTTSVVALALQKQQLVERECAAAAGAQPLSRGGRFRYMVTASSGTDDQGEDAAAAAAGGKNSETCATNGGADICGGEAAATSSAAGDDNRRRAEETGDTPASGESRLTRTEATHGAAAAPDGAASAAAATLLPPCTSTSAAAVGSSQDVTAGTCALSGGEASRSTPQQQQQHAPRFNGKESQSCAVPSGVADGKAHPTETRDIKSVETEKAAAAPAAGAAAADFDDPESEQLRLWLDGEVADLPPQRVVYAAIAQREWVEEVAIYREWVMGGACPLPAMHIPSAPLDANTDVPLDS